MWLCLSPCERLQGTRLFLFTVELSTIRDCEIRAQCWQPARIDRAYVHHRVLGGYSAKHSGDRPNVRTPRQERIIYRGVLFHPPVRLFFFQFPNSSSYFSRFTNTRPRLKCACRLLGLFSKALRYSAALPITCLPLKEEPSCCGRLDDRDRSRRFFLRRPRPVDIFPRPGAHS